jgi:hypothetical protein
MLWAPSSFTASKLINYKALQISGTSAATEFTKCANSPIKVDQIMTLLFAHTCYNNMFDLSIFLWMQ